MVQKADGMNYAPEGKAEPVCEKGEFRFAAVALDHGHIYGMCNGLLEAGGELVWVFDPDPAKVEAFCAHYPGVRAARSEAEVLEAETVQMIAGAGVPVERAGLGVRAMEHGKDYFCDKPPLTTLDQLETAKRKCAETGRNYAVYYSERLHVESAVYAGDLIEQGVIGRVVHVSGFGPHRISLSIRPDWFFDRARYGGILCDIGSHQIEQFLFYTGAKDATIISSQVANYGHKEYPNFEDFGHANLVGDNGATQYFRVDWFTPDGLGTWGDGRTFIVGTDGYIELRKYVDVGRDPVGDHVYLVTHEGEQHIPVAGKIGFPYFGQLILDSLNRTANAMSQEHAFKAIELAIKAQVQASQVE